MLEYLRPDTIEAVTYEPESGNVQASAGNEQCSTHRHGVQARNSIGQLLWRYNTRTFWCRDTFEWVLTRDPNFTQHGAAHFLFWEFVGHTSVQESGGEGDASHWDYASGHFRLCITNLGCIIHNYPWVDKWQYGTGVTDEDEGW